MTKIVDCHMHALTKEEFDLYQKTACADKVINIRGLYIDETLDPYSFEEFASNDNMYFIDSVDLDDIENEIAKVDDDLKKYPRIIAIKIYLGYQKYYANDEKIFKVVEYASKHNLSVTFHCGEIYGENGESVFSPYSDAKYIEDLAIKFPKVNFIASHLNWPNFDSIFYLCDMYKNVYTCFSGCNDGESIEERKKQNKAISDTINKFIKQYPSVKKKIMYGTDFFAISEEYSDVSSYIEVLDNLDINNTEKEDIIYNNVCKAYNIKF
jgi:predicted TIM-barrel fold metal-dependent hydrolase